MLGSDVPGATIRMMDLRPSAAADSSWSVRIPRNTCHERRLKIGASTVALVRATILAVVTTIQHSRAGFETGQVCVGRRVAEELFVTCEARLDVLTSPVWFENNTSTLHHSLRQIGLALNEIREMLAFRYSQVEEDCENVPLGSANKLYGSFWRCLLGCRQSMKSSKDIVVTPL